MLPRVCRHAQVKSVEEATPVLVEGQRANTLYLVLSGGAEVDMGDGIKVEVCT